MLNQWFLVISSHNILKQSKNEKKIDLLYQCTPTLEVTQFHLHKSSKHQPMEQYQWSADCSEIDLKSDVNWLASGELQQSTNVYSQWEIFS